MMVVFRTRLRKILIFNFKNVMKRESPTVNLVINSQISFDSHWSNIKKCFLF